MLFYHRLEWPAILCTDLFPPICYDDLQAMEPFLATALVQSVRGSMVLMADPEQSDRWLAGRYTGSLPLTAYRQSLGTRLMIPWQRARIVPQVFVVTGSFLYGQQAKGRRGSMDRLRHT